MLYYRINVAPGIGRQWFPAEPVRADGLRVDARDFTTCVAYNGPPLSLNTSQKGEWFALNFGPFDIPIAETGLAYKLAALAGTDVQLVDAAVDGQRPSFIVNVLACRDCIDEARTVGKKWEANDGRPDRLGMYRMIVRLFIDPQRVMGSHVFRIRGWKTPLLVSEDVVANLSPQDRRGVVLVPVT